MLLGPLGERVLISHTLVASATDDNQIIQHSWATLGFGDIMSTLKVEDCDGICAPCCHTFSLEGGAHISDPELFPDCLGYLLLVSHPIGVWAGPFRF